MIDKIATVAATVEVVDKATKVVSNVVNTVSDAKDRKVNRAEQQKNGDFERTQGALDRELERSEKIKNNKLQRGISVTSTMIDSLTTLSNIGSNISDIINTQRNSKASTYDTLAKIQRDNELHQGELQKLLAEAKKLETDSETAMLDVPKKYETLANNQNQMHQQRMKEMSEGHEERMEKIKRDSDNERERILNERKIIEMMEQCCRFYMETIRQLILSDLDSNKLTLLMNYNSQLTTLMLDTRRSLSLPYSIDNGDYQ